VKTVISLPWCNKDMAETTCKTHDKCAIIAGLILCLQIVLIIVLLLVLIAFTFKEEILLNKFCERWPANFSCLFRRRTR